MSNDYSVTVKSTSSVKALRYLGTVQNNLYRNVVITDFATFKPVLSVETPIFAPYTEMFKLTEV